MRHRLSRAGNRRINHALYMAGIIQLPNDTAGRRDYRRLLADGKTRWKPCGACALEFPTSPLA